eukprot:gnl/TRDRNA2_/TRDRNA2_102318_c0_seq2.p2 gnl/TRDRNA2_/TRDRNA2_102318_c0~~gnl/TRDRNA2_/TRDRNA2_102318_c0_seq2.p2  ORF type:complete len:118 (-),score=6.07 gnl/TRDRNA2_/TRDRNA2_102318_c0_seq2:31-384(-)
MRVYRIANHHYTSEHTEYAEVTIIRTPLRKKGKYKCKLNVKRHTPHNCLHSPLAHMVNYPQNFEDGVCQRLSQHVGPLALQFIHVMEPQILICTGCGHNPVPESQHARKELSEAHFG